MTSPILTLNLPPDHPLRMILDVIETHPEVREPLLRVLLTERLLALPEQVDKLQGDFEEFRDETRERFDGIDQRFDGVNQRFDGIDQRSDEHQQRFDGIDQRLDDNTSLLGENTASTKRLEGHVGRMRGLTYEDSCRYYIGVILDGFLDGPVLADREIINNQLLKARRDDLISRTEYQHGISPDIIARAQDDASHSERLAVVEASVTFNQRDLQNAATRAAIIGRVTGVRTDAFVATHYPWPDDVGEVARQLGVTIVRQESDEHAYDA